MMKSVTKVGLVVAAIVAASLPYLLHLFIQSPPYKKSLIVLNNHMEASPFVWEGDLYYLVTARETHTDRSRLEIVRFSDGTVVSEFAQDYGLASAFVKDGTLFVLGTKGWTSEASEIALFSTTDLTTFEGPQLVKQGSAEQTVFNTSAVALNDQTIVAYEVHEPGLVLFSARFLRSFDGTKFEEVGGVFGSEFYAACPTIRFIGEHYYLWYLANNNGTYETRIARSKDLSSWEVSPVPFMVPGQGEDINTSDVDLVTHEGQTYIFYSISDQKTYSKLTYAVFAGDVEQLVGNYFGWRFAAASVLDRLNFVQPMWNMVRASISLSRGLGFLTAE